MTKRCAYCGEVKSIDQFRNKPNKRVNKVYKATDCRDCNVIYQRARLHGDPLPKRIIPRKGRTYRTSHQKLKDAIFKAYGKFCNCCGETEEAFLVIDHKYGGGSMHRKTLGLYKTYKSIVDEGFPETYQVLCQNCNQAKRFSKPCPHSEVDWRVPLWAMLAGVPQEELAHV